MPPLDNAQAQQELYTNNYKIWVKGNAPQRRSNAPTGCSEIYQSTADNLRRSWNPKGGNVWNQAMSNGFLTKAKDKRWVTKSVSGGNTVIDFHAYYDSKSSFLWHFKVVSR